MTGKETLRFGDRSFRSKEGRRTLVREVLQLDSIRWNPPKPGAGLSIERQAKLQADYDRSYQQFDAARDRTATSGVVANGAGLVTAISFLSARSSLHEGAGIVLIPAICFLVGIFLGFSALYLGQLYRRFQVKTIGFAVAGSKSHVERYREWRKVISVVLRIARTLAIIAFFLGAAWSIARIGEIAYSGEGDPADKPAQAISSSLRPQVAQTDRGRPLQPPISTPGTGTGRSVADKD